MDHTPAGAASGLVVDVGDVDLPGLGGCCDPDGAVALPVLVDFLTRLEVGGLPTDFDVLEVVAAWDRVANAVAGQRLAAVAELASRAEVIGADDDPGVQARRALRAPAGTTTRHGLGDEVSARLGESPFSAQRWCQAGMELPHRFPVMAGLLAAGRASQSKALALVDACGHLPDDLARQVDARVAGRAHRQAPSRFRQVVRRAVLRVAPQTAVERRERAEADRCVRVTSTSDGMAELWALLPAASATALMGALDTHARAARSGGDERTMDQLRADGLTAGITTTVEVHVVVPASVLLGLGDGPGELVRFGSIDADLARTLAADATWRRILTDPDDGALLSLGTDTYRPGAVLDRLVRTRDRTCRFPTCDRPADRSDLDHTIPFAQPGGSTDAGNLGPLCRRHHRYKHGQPPDAPAPPRLEQPFPGTFWWTMPTGHQYDVHPPRLLEPDDPLHTVDATDDGFSLAEYGLHHLLVGIEAGRAAA